MNSVRIWYKKSGLVIYTSHLDMNRCFTRAVRRADIPLWYTEGFNPHPYLNFLLPLPLGQSGEKEPIDIKIEEDIPLDEIGRRLNSVLPEGLEIVAVTSPVNKVNEITEARYIIDIEFASGGEAEGFASGAAAVIESGVLNAEKRSKRGIQTVNLCEFIVDFNVSCEGRAVHIDTCLATGTQRNLNASLLVDSLLGEFGAESEKLSISRREIYTENKKIFA